MRAHGPSAPAYVLLGLIRQAAGNLEQAEHCFGRAVYLQPDHYEALIHLAFLLERRGDTARQPSCGGGLSGPCTRHGRSCWVALINKEDLRCTARDTG